MRKNVATLLSLLVLVAMVIGVYQYLRPFDGPDHLVLTRMEGPVTLEGISRSGPAVPGSEVFAADHLIVGERGRAVLELQGGTRVRIGPSSSVVVRSVSDAGVELELEGGAVRATVRPESGAVAVTGAGVTAQATEADFEMGVRGELAVIEAREGDVAVMGADITRVTAGSRAVIERRAAAVGPIPTDLLLTVDWPRSGRTRERLQPIGGTTDPGSQVVVRGAFGEQAVQADENGHFALQIPLVEGPNPIQVDVVDLLGKSKETRGELPELDTSAPVIRGGVEYGP